MKEQHDIFRAIVDGDTAGVGRLIETGMDVNTKDIDNCTPLHRTSDHGHAGIIVLLLDAGADPNVRDKWDNTPLNLALRLKTDDPHREQILDLFRGYAPEMVMEVYCSQSPGGMR